jgi:2-aminoethylphosphonate-pyruvate transaminase
MNKNRPQILLTPGPLTTSAATKEAMLRDWGSRDADFIATTARVRKRLEALAGAAGTHACVMLQGSGTFVVEATLGTLVPAGAAGKLLVLINGAYGRRMARICDTLGRAYVSYETPENVPPTGAEIADLLAADGAITHVAAVHCETTSGILNPIEDIAAATADAGRALIIDAMSTFGALPIDAGEIRFAALCASANKCLEGVPGVGFAIIETSALAAAAGNAPSLSLDLHDQWRVMEDTGQWRFTPPTHVVAALDQALGEHAAEGGIEARFRRYEKNCRVLVAGLRDIGFETFLPDRLQAPIIVTVRMPRAPKFAFERLFELLHAEGIVIYPGSVTTEATFRIGCIGRIGEDDMKRTLAAIGAALKQMGVAKGRLAPAQ